MKFMVKIDREAAIREGYEPRDIAIVEIPSTILTPDQREVCADLASYGYTDKYDILIPTSFATFKTGNPEEILSVLTTIAEEMRKEDEKQKEANEKQIAKCEAFISDPFSFLRAYYDGDMLTHWGNEGSPNVPNGMPELEERVEAARMKMRDEMNRRNEEIRKEKEARWAKEAEEKKAKKEKLLADILSFLREHGTPSQVERWEAGVLPEKEFKVLLRKVFFGKIEWWPRYKKIDGEVTHHEYHCAGIMCEVHYTTDILEEMTETEWENLKLAKSLLPECDIIPTLHTAWATCNEDVETTRSSILVRASRFGLEVSREYDLPHVKLTEPVKGPDPRD